MDDGRGVLQAVAHVHQELAPALVGLEVADQRAIDARMIERDASPHKRRLGANALLAVSLAAAHAAAAVRGVPLFRHLAMLGSDTSRAPVMPVRGSASGVTRQLSLPDAASTDASS